LKKEYLDLLNQLVEEKDQEDINDNILIVDGLNNYLRGHFSTLMLNENAEYVGGITGFFLSLGYAIKVLNPTRVIIVFDGTNGSDFRKKLYPQYKANRSEHKLSEKSPFKTLAEDQQAMKFQLMKLMQYLSFFPVQILISNNNEADDVISFLVKESILKNNKMTIMSTDCDFLQLIDENISVWSPTKKIEYTNNNFKEFYDLTPKNYLIFKCLIGDRSDNIEGIKGVGLKTLKKYYLKLFENESLTPSEFINDLEKLENQGKVIDKIILEKEKFLLNLQLIQLIKSNLDKNSKIIINNYLEKPIPRLLKHKILKLIMDDYLNSISIFKNPEVWLKQVWYRLDFLAEQTHDK